MDNAARSSVLMDHSLSHEFEKLQTVAKAIEIVTGIRPSPMQVHRHTTVGSAGIVLQTTFLGGRKFTCVSDVRQWIVDVTAKRHAMTRTMISRPAAEAKRQAQSQAFLDSEGV